jgi:hypothetical protein
MTTLEFPSPSKSGSADHHAPGRERFPCFRKTGFFRAVSGASFLLVAAPTARAGSIALVEGAIERNLAFVSDLAAGDIDADGDLDLVGTVLPTEDRVVWWENPGTDAGPETWTRRDVNVAIDGGDQVAVGFFDSDAFLDVVATIPGRMDVTWYRNPGPAELATAATWESSIIEARKEGLGEIRVADIDGDGNSDVVITALVDQDVSWYINPGGDAGGIWDEVVTDLDVADVNGDGFPDLIVTSPAEEEIRWYKNPGGADSRTANNWPNEFVVDRNFDGVADLVAVDLDGDGDPDLASFSQSDSDLVFSGRRPSAPSNATATLGRSW